MKRLSKKKKLSSRAGRKYRIQKYINYFIWITLIGAGVFAFFTARWTALFVSGLAFILTFLPVFFERRYKIYIPVEFEILVVVFVYAGLFLGEVRGYYTIYWWWDVVLHATSAIAFGIIGFVILFILYKRGEVQAHPIWLALFSFSFAVMIGAVWEIFEFGMDQFFGLNMQKSGLIDTMWDLIVDSGGALIASLLGFLYLKGEKRFSLAKLMGDFIEENPMLFKS
jgi:hypothetical protein